MGRICTGSWILCIQAHQKGGEVVGRVAVTVNLVTQQPSNPPAFTYRRQWVLKLKRSRIEENRGRGRVWGETEQATFPYPSESLELGDKP